MSDFFKNHEFYRFFVKIDEFMHFCKKLQNLMFSRYFRKNMYLSQCDKIIMFATFATHHKHVMCNIMMLTSLTYELMYVMSMTCITYVNMYNMSCV